MYGRKMSSDSTIKAEAVADDVKGHKCMLVLDCRSQNDYNQSHIKGAISIFLPSLMLRRLKAGKLNIGCIIQNNEAKEKFSGMWKTQTTVLYDEKPEPAAVSPTSVIGLLYKKLKQDGARVVFLQGKHRTKMICWFTVLPGTLKKPQEQFLIMFYKIDNTVRSE